MDGIKEFFSFFLFSSISMLLFFFIKFNCLALNNFFSFNFLFFTLYKPIALIFLFFLVSSFNKIYCSRLSKLWNHINLLSSKFLLASFLLLIVLVFSSHILVVYKICFGVTPKFIVISNKPLISSIIYFSLFFFSSNFLIYSSSFSSKFTFCS